MKLKIKNFRGAFAYTYEEPTEKELKWLFQNLDKIDWDKHFSSTWKTYCEYCHHPGDEYKESRISTYRISTAEITDVPIEDWDNGGDRGLQIDYCEECHYWVVGDY
jgi:hypothetical protein